MKTTDWQTILWREWRYSQDGVYARHLYDIVAGTPATPLAFGVLMLFNMVTGAAIGLVLGLLLTTQGSVLQQVMLAGAVLGGIYGGWTGWQISWRSYLSRLGASLPVGRPQDWLVGGVLLLALGTFTFGPAFWIGLIGLFWGMGGLINWLNSGVEAPTNEYTYRQWYFWWRPCPAYQAVEAALQQACAESDAARRVWSEPLRRLAEVNQPTEPVEVWLKQVTVDDWVTRLIARRKILLLGDEAIRTLHEIKLDEENPLQPTAVWLLATLKVSQSSRTP